MMTKIPNFSRLAATTCGTLLLFLTTSGIVTAQDKILPPVPEGAWTVAVIPDTQYYSQKDANAPIFTEMTQWLAAHRDERNIKLVLHVGDIVQDNEDRQWQNAKKSMQVLDGKIPYVLAVGNHDLGRNARSRKTMLNQYFKISDNPLNEKMLGGVFKQGELENAWYHFRHNGWEAIIFSLEFGPREEVVNWANQVAAKHADKAMILVTHEFIDQESTLSSDDGLPRRTTRETTNNPHKYPISKQAKVHCGEELWQAFVSKYPNFRLVVNGHYKPFERVGNNRLRHVHDLTSVHRSDSLKEGHHTHQMLFNAQWAPRGGHGWLRLLEFQPDGKTVK
ncbi:MAG: metallophosphoesterase, partial [Verrucomicrobiae bacterium]|nr:metallophosphoesterase [Verrucomicrobiae bacterium]